MKEYNIKLSNKNAQILEKLVGSGKFKSLDFALGNAVANYLSRLKQQGLAVNIIIDPQPADNGGYRTQKEWIAYFNKLGKPMISAPNMYQAGKTASDEVLDSLRKDFDEHWIVSSTRIKYNPNDLSALIVHNFGSTVVKPKKIALKVIPVYESTILSHALDSEDGVLYNQALYDTRDDPKTITEVLENLSKRKADNIRLWTPSQSSRNSYPERAGGFFDDYGRFHVAGYVYFDYYFGRSRGVSMSPRSGRAKK